MAWLLSHIDHDGDDCLIWPFFRVEGKGYGRIDKRFAHRVMCEIVNGDPPFEEAQAAHSCGKGHDGCVHPKHLRWDTAQGNVDDRERHGTNCPGERNGSVKLTRDQVERVRSLAGTRRSPGAYTQTHVAEMFGISQSQVSAIVRGGSW